MRKFSVRRIILILIDLICIILASFLALFLRFNGEIPSYYFYIFFIDYHVFRDNKIDLSND